MSDLLKRYKGTYNASNLWVPQNRFLKIALSNFRPLLFRRRLLESATRASRRGPTTGHRSLSSTRCGRVSGRPLPGWCADCMCPPLRPNAHCGRGLSQSPQRDSEAAYALQRAPNESSTQEMPFRTCILGDITRPSGFTGQGTDRLSPTPKYRGNQAFSQCSVAKIRSPQ